MLYIKSLYYDYYHDRSLIISIVYYSHDLIQGFLSDCQPPWTFKKSTTFLWIFSTFYESFKT